MALLEVMRPLAAPREVACSSGSSLTENVALDYAPFESHGGNGKSKVTFLLNLPWGGTAVATVPLLELPVLTVSEMQQLPYAATGGQATLQCLQSSTGLHASAVGLYLPGSFLFPLATARAGLGETSVAASKLRLVLQQQEVYATSFLPLDMVVGSAAAAEVAAARGGAAAATAIPAMDEEVSRGAPLCSLWLLLRLPGGKGGFGALLKKQRRKKRANFSVDACRDLTGRRIRQAQVVTRIKAWMEKKRKEDALIGVLAQGTHEKLPESKPAVSLDAGFISQQVAQVSEMPGLVAHGLKQQEALRKEQETEQRTRAAAPQNAAVFAQLRDAVELDSEDDHWSDIDADEIPQGADHDSGRSSSSSCSSSSSSSRPTSGSSGADRSNRAGAASSSTSKACTGVGSSSRSSNCRARPAKPDAAAQALMQQLEQMQLQAAAAAAAERERKAAAAAELAKAAAAAEKAAAAAAERVAREAQQLDVSRFSTAEELARAVDQAVVKEKLKQLGWKCGGRPEERAARLLQLKTVDLANVPKALVARQATRMA